MRLAITDLLRFCRYSVFEKLIFNRLISFVDNNGILSDSQFGFRKNSSTEMAIVHVVNKILGAIENNKFSIGIFLDLPKAFDTVNHDILIRKLDQYTVYVE